MKQRTSARRTAMILLEMGKHGVCVSRDSWWDASERKVLQVRA
jgi:hypothetical protein